MKQALHIQRHPNVIFTVLSDDEAVLLNMENKFYYTLNSVGSYLWQLLENGPMSHHAMAIDLQKHFEIPDEQARNDVHEFLMNLLEEKLIEESNVE